MAKNFIKGGWLTNAENAIVIPLATDPGEEVVGLDGNEVVFSDGQKERIVQLPFHSGAMVRHQTLPLNAAAEGDDVGFVGVVTPDQLGNAYLEVEVEQVYSHTFAVARVVKKV